MGYTAYEGMKKRNEKLWGISSPEIPSMFKKIRVWKKDENGSKKALPDYENISELEEKAICFIRDDCEGLRFDRTDEKRIKLEDYDGKSIKTNQVPYNFEMDMDRRCLEIAIHRFMESGEANEAFDVYFCFLEMFIERYGKTNKMIEMLSEFETNASSLLMKHRDHYSHSVYVFVIGLALYHESDVFRASYRKKYGKAIQKDGYDVQNDHDVAAHFLKYWGITALFHDIGYPFELSFEQVKSYFGDTIEYVPYVAYNMNNFNKSKLDDVTGKVQSLIGECAIRFEKLMEETDKNTYESEKDNLQRLAKKVKGLFAEIYGENSEEYEEKQKSILSICDDEKHTEPSKGYRLVITVLKQFINDIDRIKSINIDKLKNLMIDVSIYINSDDRNAFLAQALYDDIGDRYAYYDKEKTRRSDSYQRYTNRQQDKMFYDYRDYLYEVLCRKPEHPEEFGGHIDHAYFSSIILLDMLIKIVDKDQLNEMYTHSLTAILLHNSIYKYLITDCSSEFNNGRHFNLNSHPLAYLLMLCDELQSWDRASYGRNSRGEVHPFDCEFGFSGNKIVATYLFDKNQYKDQNGDLIKEEYKGARGTYFKLCDDGTGKSDFLRNIENIVSINGDNSFGEINGIRLDVKKRFAANNRYYKSNLSKSNFIHLYNFSIMVHKMNHLEGYIRLDKKQIKQMEDEFEQMSLEYKINHISRAKKFSKILASIDCFYSDNPMDCEIVTSFGEELNNIMGAIEHERWCWEHFVMGWRHISKDEFEVLKEKYPEDSKRIRECIKRHPDMLEIENGEGEDKEGYEYYRKEAGIEHFKVLDEDHGHDKNSKEKDIRSMNNLLKVLSVEDGVKVYRLK